MNILPRPRCDDHGAQFLHHCREDIPSMDQNDIKTALNNTNYLVQNIAYSINYILLTKYSTLSFYILPNPVYLHCVIYVN